MALLEALFALEAALPTLIDEPGWQSLKIDYHPPHVDRLWRPWKDKRVFLHRILPCQSEEALLHRHPWPAAIRILNGRYEMGLAHGPGPDAPMTGARMVMTAGSAYEMTDPLVWHSVAPIAEPSLSVMVTGPRWGPGSHKPDYQLSPLTEAAQEELRALFRAAYPKA